MCWFGISSWNSIEVSIQIEWMNEFFFKMLTTWVGSSEGFGAGRRLIAEFRCGTPKADSAVVGCGNQQVRPARVPMNAIYRPRVTRQRGQWQLATNVPHKHFMICTIQLLMSQSPQNNNGSPGSAEQVSSSWFLASLPVPVRLFPNIIMNKVC